MPSNRPESDEHSLRERLIKQRSALSDEVCKKASEGIKDVFTESRHCMEGSVFGGYAAVNGEIDIFPLINKLLYFKRTCALPRVNKTTGLLTFHEWKPGDALIPDSSGRPSPDASLPEVKPQVFIIPVVACDAHGYRLGDEADYYLNTLKALRNTHDRHKKDYNYFYAIGAAYSFQKTNRLPNDFQNDKLHGLVTEKGIVWFDEWFRGYE